MNLCDNWITEVDLIDCDCPNDADESIVTAALAAASEWTYHASGRRWPGTCTTTERPCGCGCGCGIFPTHEALAWSDYYRGLDCGCSYGLCGCTSQAVIETTYGPVTGTPTITIDGVAFTDFAVVAPNRLLRTDGDAWPTCQSYASDSVGLLVEYSHGAAPPQLGKFAAADIAAEIIKSCTGGACALPAGTVNVVRRNISIRMEPDQAARALARVAMFLNAYPTQTTQPDVRRPGTRGLVTSGPA